MFISIQSFSYFTVKFHWQPCFYLDFISLVPREIKKFSIIYPILYYLITECKSKSLSWYLQHAKIVKSKWKRINLICILAIVREMLKNVSHVRLCMISIILMSIIKSSIKNKNAVIVISNFSFQISQNIKLSVLQNLFIAHFVNLMFPNFYSFAILINVVQEQKAVISVKSMYQ